MQYSSPMTSCHLLKTPAFTWVLFTIILIHLVHGTWMTSPLTLGLYVDDFSYFSKDPAIDSLLLLASQAFQNRFCGHCIIIPWHLFLLACYNVFGGCSSQPILLCIQPVESFFCNSRDPTLTCLHYKSGFSLDALPHSWMLMTPLLKSNAKRPIEAW
jgi:hypothetical protein